MKYQTSRMTATLLLSAVLLTALSVTGYSQIYTSFKDLYASQYPNNPLTYCNNHTYLAPSLGRISAPIGESINGLAWEAVRPTGATIIITGAGGGPIAGTVAGYSNVQEVRYPVLSGTLYRLQTQGDYLGFTYKGAWANTPFKLKGSSLCSHTNPSSSCAEPSPVAINNANLRVLAYDTIRDSDNILYPERLIAPISGFAVPAKSTITVTDASGIAVPNCSVLLLNNDRTWQFNTQTLMTNTAGEVQYCVPNRVRMDDFSVPYVWTLTGGTVDVRGHFAVEHNGFLHTAPMQQDCSGGVSREISLPPDSTVTVYKYGVPKQYQSVYVTQDVGTQTLIKDFGTTTTGTNGTATFAIPRGMQYRYVAIDSDGTQTWSDLLTAPTSGASGTHTVMKMFANYSPALSTPADNASFDVSDTINFSWNGVSNAISKYVWLYRFSEDSDYSGYVLNGTSLNGVQFNLPGTWYWVVQAYDSDSELIAQSEIRAFTLDDSSSQSSSASRARQSTNVNNVLPVANVLSANVVKAENVTVRSFDSETTESSESIAQQAAFLEEEEMLMFEYWLMGYPMDTHTFPLGCDVLSVEQLSTPEDNQSDSE